MLNGRFFIANDKNITLKIILIKQIADGISNVKPLDIFIQYAQITSKIPAINKNNQAIFVVSIFYCL